MGEVWGWYRPTHVFASEGTLTTVWSSPFGRERTTLFVGDVVGLLERQADHLNRRGHDADFLRWRNLFAHKAFHLAHYVGFKLRHPLRRFRAVDFSDVLERLKQRRMQTADLGSSKSGVCERKHAFCHDNFPSAGFGKGDIGAIRRGSPFL